MLFFNPLLLWGLSLVAVPIIIYIIFQRKVKQTQWAAMQFLIDIIEERKRKMQIEDLLLLLLRILVIAALAAAAARPFLGGGLGSMFSSSRVVILLDGSYSMSATSGVTTRWQEAQQAAINLVNELDSDADISLVIATELPESRIGEFTSDHDLVVETIRSLTPTDLAGSPAASLEYARTLLLDYPGDAATIYLVSDFQERDWLAGSESLTAALQSLPDNVAVQLVPVSDEEKHNTAVSEVRVVGGAARVGSDTRIIGSVRLHGGDETETVTVELLINDQPIEQRSVTATPGQDVDVTFNWLADSPGWYRATVRVAGDALDADNERHLALPVVESVKVLCVAEDAGNKRHAADFMALALDSRAIGKNAEESLFKFTWVSPDDFIGERLGDYDLVVWAHVNQPSATDAEYLQRHLAGGGGALIFLGPETDPLAYNLAFAPGVDEAEGEERPVLFPVPLVEEALGIEDPEAPLLLKGATPGHPVWRSLLGEGIDYLAPVDVFVAWPFARDLGGQGVTLATVALNDESDALPAIVDLRHGRGHALVIATSADLSWTNFPLRPAFIGFINQAVPYLRSFEHGDSNMIVGESARRYVAFERSQATYQVTTPDGGISTASVLETEDGYALELPVPRVAGAYELMNTEDALDRGMLVANVRLNEGDITALSTSDLVKRYANDRVGVVGTSATGTSGTSGTHLAGLLLLLMVLFWLGENLLAHKIAKQS